MAFKVVILDTAQREYREIVSYMIEVLKSPQAAANFMDTFDEQMALAAEVPSAFPLSRMPELAAKGYHAAPVNNYLVLYRATGEVIAVAHVFHQTQDYARLV